MIQAADIREWRTHDVADPDGHRVGALEAVCVDTSSDEQAMATVVVGLPTRHRLVFVPLGGAIVGPGYVKVAYTRSLVKSCPSIGTEDVLPAEDEEASFQRYGMAYQPGAAPHQVPGRALVAAVGRTGGPGMESRKSPRELGRSVGRSGCGSVAVFTDIAPDRGGALYCRVISRGRRRG